MRHKNRNVLLLSAATITCAAALIIGSSFAIFTDTANVNHHLQAGKLKVGLNRTKLVKNGIQPDGTLEVTTDETNVDLVADPSKVFKMMAVPGSYAEATIVLSNKGDVAFDYTIRTVWENNPKAADFANQVKITINGTFDYTLDTCNDESNYLVSETPILTTEGNNSKTFVIRAEFENLDEDGSENNKAQGQVLDFDLLVQAKQHI